MKIFEANISMQVCSFLNNLLNMTLSFENINQKMFDAFGIKHFFDSIEDFQKLKESLTGIAITSVEQPDRTEYGDFQTNKDLAFKIAKQLSDNNISPEIVIEPTCGTGNFIVATLSCFKSIKKLFGIEIYKPYVWETKFSIVDFYLSNPGNPKPEITIIHSSIFDFNFTGISKQFSNKSLLIIGNPPWVTNSQLGCLNSSNLPPKSNFKNQNGLDSITGKGNFDIAESIILMIFDTFQNHNAHLLHLFITSKTISIDIQCVAI